MQMKILMVNKFLYQNGGAENYVIRLGQYLELLGHQVQYFGMEDEKNIVGNKSNSYAPHVDFRYAKGSLKKIRMGFETIYSRTACSSIGKVLTDFAPDIVHLNNINFQITPAIIYEIKKHDIPIVQTLHDVQIACPCHRFYIEHNGRICEECRNGAYFHCIKNKCLHNSILKSALAALESYYYHKRDTYNLVDMYICPSRFIAEKTMNAGVDTKKLKVIRNFADIIADTQKEQAKDNENLKKYPISADYNITKGKYALYFGRLSKEKGILSLLQVCSELPEIHLIIVGGGPLEKIVREKSEFLPNVQYAGYKSGGELQKLIADASFSICPSECCENCPLSVVEAQTLGTPVIGSDFGGTKELITHGKNGLLYKGGDNKQLKNAILTLWHDDSMIKAMRAECHKITPMVLEEYAACILSLYQKLCTEKEAK